MLCRERKTMRVERKDNKEREWNVKMKFRVLKFEYIAFEKFSKNALFKISNCNFNKVSF